MSGKQLVKPTTYKLDDLELLWKEFEIRKQRHDEDSKWLEEFKHQLDRVSGGADAFTLRGQEVATYRRNGNFNFKRFESEHPDLAARYTRLVTEMKFDKDAFEADDPGLFAEYKAKVFRLPTRTPHVGIE